MTSPGRRTAIVVIVCALAALGACTLIFNPGQYGMTPRVETPLPD